MAESPRERDQRDQRDAGPGYGDPIQESSSSLPSPPTTVPGRPPRPGFPHYPPPPSRSLDDEAFISSTVAIWGAQIAFLLFLPGIICSMQDQTGCRDCIDCADWLDLWLACGIGLLGTVVLSWFVETRQSGVRWQLCFLLCLYGGGFVQVFVWYALTGQLPFKENSR